MPEVAEIKIDEEKKLLDGCRTVLSLQIQLEASFPKNGVLTKYHDSKKK